MGALVLAAFMGTGSALAAQGTGEGEDSTFHHQVFVRGGYAQLTNSDGRGGEVFTDTLGLGGELNDDAGGFSVAAGLDLSALRMQEFGGINLMGEIFVEFARYSDRRVLQTTSALLGGTATARVNISSLNVTIAPKARFDALGNGRFRPFVIPVGVSFLVNSPPSNDTTYLDIGMHFGAGLDILIIERVSVGADFRYTHGFETTHTDTSYWSTGAYLALNF